MTTAEALVEAEAAWHRLMTGAAVVEFHDQNGEIIKYQMARKGDLATYIQGLKDLLAGNPSTTTGPMRVFI